RGGQFTGLDLLFSEKLSTHVHPVHRVHQVFPGFVILHWHTAGKRCIASKSLLTLYEIRSFLLTRPV
ncbi:MAG: hypothetical protein LBR29_05990, partial [Methylobacteriaceae bacterium]|nr:hypothetical protein [Methylobacteriaceae bacterium]